MNNERNCPLVNGPVKGASGSRNISPMMRMSRIKNKEAPGRHAIRFLEFQPDQDENGEQQNAFQHSLIKLARVTRREDAGQEFANRCAVPGSGNDLWNVIQARIDFCRLLDRESPPRSGVQVIPSETALPMGRLAGLPYNSPLMKFASRPKKRPTGATATRLSPIPVHEI